VLFTVLTVINALLLVYLFLLSLRVILGWFSVAGYGKAWDLLCGITDPYLELFRRMRFLKRGIFDFTPVAAVLVLVVAMDIVSALLYSGRVTLGFFLASLLSAAWSGARFLILLFLVVGVLRLLPVFFRGLPGSTMWKVADLILQPAVLLVTRLLKPGPRSSQIQYLLLTVGFLFVAWLLGELAVNQMVALLRELPI
jgi:YggT family protein